MKYFIILISILAIGCTKSKIRTCTGTLVDGTKVKSITEKPMTREEMNAYENWKEHLGYKSYVCH